MYTESRTCWPGRENPFEELQETLASEDAVVHSSHSGGFVGKTLLLFFITFFICVFISKFQDMSAFLGGRKRVVCSSPLLWIGP